ncbi:hypothetical protein CP8484711_1300, partial [Chlamydia psittaci 84-8471/1]
MQYLHPKHHFGCTYVNVLIKSRKLTSDKMFYNKQTLVGIKLLN